MTAADRRSVRLARYEQLRAERPHLFVNPPAAAYEILFDRADQDAVADEAAGRLRAAGIPEEYGDIGIVYEDQYFLLVRDAVRFRTGRRGGYVRFVGTDPGANVAVVPLVSDGRMVLVRHFRHGTRQWHWEIPRGFSEPGAAAVSTARRELAEEVGLRVDTVRLLGRVCTDGDLDEIYLAELEPAAVAGLASSPPATGDAVEEGIDEIRLVSLVECARMIAEGEIVDMYLLAAYAFLAVRGIGFGAPPRG
ncbi:MAG TPA: NUDIX hydrolase [Pilimelia sp.]|nr:NUDIX hydrolase [Pilimelia sp.]